MRPSCAADDPLAALSRASLLPHSLSRAVHSLEWSTATRRLLRLPASLCELISSAASMACALGLGLDSTRCAAIQQSIRHPPCDAPRATVTRVPRLPTETRQSVRPRYRGWHRIALRQRLVCSFLRQTACAARCASSSSSSCVIERSPRFARALRIDTVISGFHVEIAEVASYHLTSCSEDEPHGSTIIVLLCLTFSIKWIQVAHTRDHTAK